MLLEKKSLIEGVKHIRCIQRPSKTYSDELRQKCLFTMAKIDKLSNHKWHFYRKLLNQSDFESREFAVNRAFYKLWEMTLRYDLIQSLGGKDVPKTLHLAEAPGSFIQVVKKMRPNATVVAVSKPPSTYAEVVKKSRAIPVFAEQVIQLPGVFCNYVDMTKYGALHYFINKQQQDGKFEYITADGGFDEEEQYDLKEILHYDLILSEIVSILCLQKQGGTCVLKIFETYTDTTMNLLWLLCSHYESYDIVKPDTSRPTNAEKYVICKKFAGLQYDQESLISLVQYHLDVNKCTTAKPPENFVDFVCSKSSHFVEKQIETINGVMDFVAKTGEHQYINKAQYNSLKEIKFAEWKKLYNYED